MATNITNTSHTAWHIYRELTATRAEAWIMMKKEAERALTEAQTARKRHESATNTQTARKATANDTTYIVAVGRKGDMRAYDTTPINAIQAMQTAHLCARYQPSYIWAAYEAETSPDGQTRRKCLTAYNPATRRWHEVKRTQ